MSRSGKKGPFVDAKLYRKVQKATESGGREPIKTWARACTVVPEFVGHTFMVHNGRVFNKVFVTEDMVGHKLGEFSLTRIFRGHSGPKKAVPGERAPNEFFCPTGKVGEPLTMAWKATHMYARLSARKARLTIDLIRDRDVQDAMNLLKFSRSLAAVLIGKVLTSAVANANEDEANVEDLFVREARIDDGPVMKRIQPKDRGRAHPILKRTSHITVVVEQEGK